MNLVKNTFFILVALLIDGLQAGISWGLAIIAAFPVTSGGSVVGCAAGNAIAGQIGCWLGGGAIGLLSVTPLGLAANAVVAQATVPLGFALGFAVNMCLSFMLGWCFLVPLMLGWRVALSGRKLFFGGGELIPGLNNIPFWTALTIAVLWNKSGTRTQKKRALALASVASVPVRPMMAAREATGMLAPRGRRGWTPQPEEWASQPQTGQDLVRLGQSRPIMADIRSATSPSPSPATKPNVQTA